MRSERELARIDSFYHLSRGDEAELFCQGTACFVARHMNQDRWSAALNQTQRTYCLGNCFVSPASSSDALRPKMESHCHESIVLGAILDGPCRSIAAYSAHDGYLALQQALDQPKEELLETIELSGLRGRGGQVFQRERSGVRLPHSVLLRNLSSRTPMKEIRELTLIVI